MKQPNSYYGGFFWIAVLSLIVPVVVAYKAFDKVRPTTKPTPTPDVSGVDHALWDYLLKQYVESGLVDYDGMAKDFLFATYLKQIGGAQPEKLETQEEKLALHCNAYNALVINSVINHKIHQNEKNVLSWSPAEAAKKLAALEKELEMAEMQPQPDIKLIGKLKLQVTEAAKNAGFFDIAEHIFAGKTISLNDLEHEIIRPTFNDPRIHVALVCAAKSCPAIRGEAYVGDRINQQLDDQAAQFAANPKYVRVSGDGKKVNLSPILSWYQEDFVSAGGYLSWVAGYADDNNLKSVLGQNPEVEFNNYDWSLNSQSGGSGGGGAKASFGSGSVPNN